MKTKIVFVHSIYITDSVVGMWYKVISKRKTVRFTSRSGNVSVCYSECPTFVPRAGNLFSY
jgi:hypothetical protein